MKILFLLALSLSFNAWAQCPHDLPGQQLEQQLISNRATIVAQVRAEGAECARQVAEKYAHHVAQSRMRDCGAAPCSPWNRNRLTLNEDAPLREAATLAVRELVFMAFPVEDIPQEITSEICLQLDPANPLALARKRGVEELLAEVNCLELNVGQARVVDTTNGNVAAGYVLERTAQNTYRLSINVNLVTSEVTPENMASLEARMRSCVADWNPVMRGPRGEQLTIQLTNPTETAALPADAPRAPVHFVQVHNNYPRANSNNYARTVDCPTIMHELMHLVGLCDEYAESDPALGYQCRVVPTQNTLMSNQIQTAGELPRINTCTVQEEHRGLWESLSSAERNVFMLPDLSEAMGGGGQAYCQVASEVQTLTLAQAAALPNPGPREISGSPTSLVIESTVVVMEDVPRAEVRRINCECTDPATMNKCRSWISQRRPQLTRPFTRRECPAIMTGVSTYGGSGTSSVSISDAGIVLNQAGTRTSALAPAHFNRILAGSCRRQAADYNICSSWAYETTCGAPQNSCMGTPEQCDGPPLQCTDERFLGIAPTR